MDVAAGEGKGARVIFLSYTSALAPLLHSQGLPHIRELARRGIELSLMSFEEAQWSAMEEARAVVLRRRLGEWGVEWHVLRYRRVPWGFASAYDVVRGAAYLARLARRWEASVVHCRSYIPSVMSVIASRMYPLKIIFDMRGLMPEEFVQVGAWTPSGLRYRAGRLAELVCMRAASRIVVTSEAFRVFVVGTRAQDGGVRLELDRKMVTIRNCVDLERFRPDGEGRVWKRSQYGLEDCRVFLWLVGHLAPWHLPEETIGFFKVCKRIMSDARLVVVTQTSGVEAHLERMGVAREDCLVLRATPEEVPGLVVIGDVGLGIFRGTPFWPMGVKLGEYLASGVPIVVNAGDAEVEGLLRDERIGAVIERLSGEDYERAAVSIREVMGEGEEVGKRCRRTAEKWFSLESAVDKYEEVYAEVLRDEAEG